MSTPKLERGVAALRVGASSESISSSREPSAFVARWIYDRPICIYYNVIAFVCIRGDYLQRRIFASLLGSAFQRKVSNNDHILYAATCIVHFALNYLYKKLVPAKLQKSINFNVNSKIVSMAIYYVYQITKISSPNRHYSFKFNDPVLI